METLTDGSNADLLHDHAASGYTDPLTTKGDLVGFSTVTDRIPVGSEGELLFVTGADAEGVAWRDVVEADIADLGTHVHTHASTTGRTADDHHAEVHTVVSHDTTATGANLTSLTDDSDAGTLHNHDGDFVTHAALGDAHHTEAHTVASHSDTTGTGAELNELTDGSTTVLHAHTGGGFAHSLMLGGM